MHFQLQFLYLLRLNSNERSSDKWLSRLQLTANTVYYTQWAKGKYGVLILRSPLPGSGGRLQYSYRMEQTLKFALRMQAVFTLFSSQAVVSRYWLCVLICINFSDRLTWKHLVYSHPKLRSRYCPAQYAVLFSSHTLVAGAIATSQDGGGGDPLL
jgi:hypothetical protein